MSNEIVVARYKEDVSWTEEFKDDYKITVYNKFKGENILKNVGRETHTYLHHIINNYDSLSDNTVFLQGEPFDHYPNLKIFLKRKLFHKQMDMLGKCIISCDVNGQPHGNVNKKMIPVGKLFEWLTLEKSPPAFIAPAGAQFCVSKNLILGRPKIFYERAIKAVDYDINPIEGHCFERLWPAIFGLIVKSDHKIYYPSKPDSPGYLENYCETGSYQEYIKKYIKNDGMLQFIEDLGPYASSLI